MPQTDAPRSQPGPANRLGLDYRAEAARLGPPKKPVIDVHTHINGERAARIYEEVCDLYGVALTYSQSQREQALAVSRVLGDRVRFVAIPDYMAADRGVAFRDGFLENIRWFHGELGARIVKFWHAPRWYDLVDPERDSDLFAYDSEWRRKALDLAHRLGMMVMTHIADPDTWFQTRYADATKYGLKAAQYEPFKRMLRIYPETPWIAAHMGGWPENLDFLDELLGEHPNLHLDTSATKWMVRELSRHSAGRFASFMQRWRGRIIFGSDIVTLDDHLEASGEENKKFGALQASSNAEAFDLYASRYWALRTMFETDYDGESPIADPDLHMVDPENRKPMDAPKLVGRSMDQELLGTLYHDACRDVVIGWEARQGVDAPKFE